MLQKIPIYKYQGETPYECIQRMKTCYPLYSESKITYAGRLDPAAEGLLILLVNDAIEQKESYLALDKIYHCDILLGISTDSYDLLGSITDTYKTNEFPTRSHLQQVAGRFTGSFEQSYPPYSSKTIDGTPLWQLAREGRITTETKLPTHEITVYSFEIVSLFSLSGNEIAESAMNLLETVTGDFRQKELKDKWLTFKDTHNATRFPIIRTMIRCSSGTYIRQIAHDLGPLLGSPSLCFWLKRTKIGDYTLPGKRY